MMNLKVLDAHKETASEIPLLLKEIKLTSIKILAIRFGEIINLLSSGALSMDDINIKPIIEMITSISSKRST